MKMPRTTVISAALLAAVVLVLAACGGGTSTAKLGKTDVAVVGGTQISKSEFDDLMATAKESFKSQGRAFPKQGTTEYSTLKTQAITLLVQQAEREEKAKSLGISITDKQIQTRLEQIKKQYFSGSEKKYKDQLAKQGLTDAQVKRDIKAQLVSEALFNKVTKDAKVTTAEVHQYYAAHPQSYVQPPSRDVRHILVKTKATADKLYGQLEGGADFAALAKKYSQDPGSKAQGGKLTVSKGQTVAPFDKVAFSLKTNELSKPVHTQYGWHIIQALSAVKPAKQTPLKSVQESIRQQLLQQKKTAAFQKWLDGVKKDFATSVRYAAGYVPEATGTTATTAPTTTG